MGSAAHSCILGLHWSQCVVQWRTWQDLEQYVCRRHLAHLSRFGNSKPHCAQVSCRTSGFHHQLHVPWLGGPGSSGSGPVNCFGTEGALTARTSKKIQKCEYRTTIWLGRHSTRLRAVKNVTTTASACTQNSVTSWHFISEYWVVASLEIRKYSGTSVRRARSSMKSLSWEMTMS